MKKLLSIIIEPYKDIPWKKVLDVIIWSLKLFSIVLVPYLTFIIVSLFLMLLTGRGELYSLLVFTRSYFYDGYFVFTAWRIHLSLFILCIIFIIRE